MTAIENLEAQFLMQKIISDTFVVNANPITVSASTFQVPETCFSVPTGKHYEFFLTLNADPLMMASLEIIEVNLISGSTVLAQASYMMDDDVLNRTYTLFYKGVNSGMADQDFEVQIKTAGGNGT